ncbi:hypothetical protein L1887_34974 [Cichorium endivia]|nr:hypothetical protein L1887_34974 [Cichorium endivia]
MSVSSALFPLARREHKNSCCAEFNKTFLCNLSFKVEMEHLSRRTRRRFLREEEASISLVMEVEEWKRGDVVADRARGGEKARDDD